MTEYPCSICGWEYQSQKEAQDCASQGTTPHELQIGDLIFLPFCGGLLYQVIELLVASHGDHLPGVRMKLIEGDNSMMFVGEETTDEAIFDEETAKKYIHQQNRKKAL